MPRRKLRTALVVFGLMLATTFVASAIAIDDTIVLAVKTVAVYNLGRIDEQVARRGGSMAPVSAAFGDQVRDSLASNSHVAGIAPALLLQNVLVADETARQVRGGVTAMAVNDAGAGPLTAFTDVNTGAPSSFTSLHDDEVSAQPQRRATPQRANGRHRSISTRIVGRESATPSRSVVPSQADC